MINEQGGINGRKINFISLDDGFQPPKTVEATRRLVEQDEVLLLFNTLGTPTNNAIHKYVNAKKVPHIFLAGVRHGMELIGQRRSGGGTALDSGGYRMVGSWPMIVRCGWTA